MINKPEVVAIKDSDVGGLIELKPVLRLPHGARLIRLSDYEALQAECDTLVESLKECVGWLEWMYHPQTSDKVDKARIQRANRALAPFRNKESK